MEKEEFLKELQKYKKITKLTPMEEKINKTILKEIIKKIKENELFKEFYFKIRNATFDKRVKIINEYINKGLKDILDISLEEIGLYLGTSRERVRQIENIAIKKIRNNIIKNKNVFELIELISKKESDY